MKSFLTFLNEVSPPSKKAEDWIKANKEEFKKQYGEDWESALYATAWKMFGQKEDTSEPTNTTDNIDNPDSPPLFKKSKIFDDCHCIEVDQDTYHRCRFGKQPYARWSGYIEDEPLRNFIKKHYSGSEKLMIANSQTGAVTYIKK